jgi:hypothetical protein
MRQDLGLPEGAAALLAGPVRSLTQLEILLVLVSDAVPVLEDRLAAMLYITVSAAAADLAALERAGLATRGPEGWRLADDPRTRAMVEELQVAYLHRRVAVIAAIYEAPHQSMRGFADAFKLREKP